MCVYVSNRHYKNVINKLRSDIKDEYTKIESNFFNEPKLRGVEICGRDKWKWYRETDEVAQVSSSSNSCLHFYRTKICQKRLKAAILSEGEGFRKSLLQKYNGK